MKRIKGDKGDVAGISRREFLKTTALGAGAAVVPALGSREALAQAKPPTWDREADVVVIGAGATGLPAAIAASEGGATVLVIEANFDVGGHAILSGGNVALGGGTSRQKKYGIKDSPELLYSDLTDWSVVEPNGFPSYRYNDREIMLAFAHNSATTYEWLVANGVIFVEQAPDNLGAGATGNSALRENHAAPMAWPQMQTGRPVAPENAATTSSGVGLVRPLEASARKRGVQFLLNHRMTGIVRETPSSGRVIGITASNEGRTINIRARRGVIIATGGMTGNVNFRRMFDPRLTEEYCGVAGEPYSVQDGSGEIAAMAIGASLWGGFNQTGEFGSGITKPGRIGCQYGYVNLAWQPGSPVFSRARATGLRVADYQDVIMVNQAGRRFYDETKGGFTNNNYDALKEYVPHSWQNAARIKYNPSNYLNAAMAGTGEPGVNGGGPIWAIFDAEAVKREKWNVAPPMVDIAAGFFFSANSITELAAAIVNKYQRRPMPGAELQETLTRYNSFVSGGKDADFSKPSPKYRIDTAPFYAAWATPVLHDTRSGLRINARTQVVDMSGNVIPGLYCGGESAGGFSLHGLARCTVQGRLAGMNAAAEPRSA
jgi:succinate dehydrogenase/fumarate reductase flavoprotein subunit